MVMIDKFNFELKTKAIFGVGEVNNLFKYIKELGYKKPGFVVDNNIIDNTSLEPIKCKKILLYDYGEPTYTLLNKNRKFSNGCDCLVGIGGGSVIDFTKGLAVLATNKKHAIEYRGFPTNINKPLPIIAIPTTAGTGSEVTYNAVFVDENKKKLGINTKLNYPKLAILDPKLVQSCPRSVMISSGLDALTHAIESYGATKSTLITRALSVTAIHSLLGNLRYIDSKGRTSLETCSNLQKAAFMAGIALMNSGSGPAGAMSYILGPQFNIPHGLAGAIFLPYVVQHNEKKGFKYPIEDLSVKLFTLYNFLNIDADNIRKYNVKKASDLQILAKGIETLQTAFDQNSVPFTVEDAKNIVRDMI